MPEIKIPPYFKDQLCQAVSPPKFGTAVAKCFDV